MVGGILQGERVWNVVYVGVEEVCGRVVCSGCSVCVWYVRVVCVGVYVCVMGGVVVCTVGGVWYAGGVGVYVCVVFSSREAMGCSMRGLQMCVCGKTISNRQFHICRTPLVW